jgi:DNA polymerase-3 subunit epsilon
MSWHNSTMCGFDLETSGVDVETDRIVQAAIVVVMPAKRLVEADVRMIDPGIEIPEQAARIHKITTERARAEGAPPADVLEHIASDLAAAMAAGLPIVGMNISFDFTMLDRELRRHGLATLEARLGGPICPAVDIFVIDKLCHPYRKGGRKLVDLCAHYGVPLADEDAHDAGADALASCRVAWSMANWGSKPPEWFTEPERRIAPKDVRTVPGNYRRLAGLSLAQLHETQVNAKAQQDASFAEYKRARGESTDGLDGHWPVRPYAGQQAIAS